MSHIVNFARIDDALVGRCGIVRANGIPGRPELTDVLRQNPCAHVGIGTRVEQALLCDAFSRQARQPRAVDLHEADIERAVAVRVDRVAFGPRFDLCDSAHQVNVDVLKCRGVLDAVGLGHAAQTE